MDPKNTYVFLIAVGKYEKDEQLHSLEQTYTNIDGLYKVLKSNSVGIPKSNILPVHDPDSAAKLVEDLHGLVSEENAETVIIYYAGHGVLDDDGKHFLTLKNSSVDLIDSNGFTIKQLKSALKSKKNINTIILLDSCFSENAFDGFDMANHLAIASSAKTKTSKYPVDEDYSAFTNELITILKEGINNGKENLSWEDVYSQLEINLGKKKFPLPKISTRNKVEKMIISKNNYNNEEVNIDKQWIRLIKEKMGKSNEDFRIKTERILKSGEPNIDNILKDHLLDGFPYPVAYYLNKITKPEAPVEEYYEFYESVIRFLFSVSFAQYEQEKDKKGFSINSGYRKYRMQFDEPDHKFYLGMLEVMSTDFKTNKIKNFMKGFDFFAKSFQQARESLENLRTSKEKDLGKVSKEIFNLIASLDFLLNFRLLSVKEVNLSYRKYDPLTYNHSVSILQGTGHTPYEFWSTPKEDWQEAFMYHPTAKNNKSVIFVDCTNPVEIHYLNLWPLIIDKNVLDKKADTPQIFIYAGKTDDDYQYQNIRNIEGISIELYSVLEAYASSNKKEQLKELIG